MVGHGGARREVQLPEYSVPGSYAKELVSRDQVIRPVDVGAALFVGPTRRGRRNKALQITQYTDFERWYGSAADLDFGPATPRAVNVNYIAHAVRAFFAEGGRQLYVARVTGAGARKARFRLTARGTDKSLSLSCVARFRGDLGNAEARFTEVRRVADAAALAGAATGSLAVSADGLAWFVKEKKRWQRVPRGNSVLLKTRELLELRPSLVTMDASFVDADGERFEYPGLAFDRRHPDWVGRVLAEKPAGREARLTQPFALRTGTRLDAGGAHAAIFAGIAADPSGRLVRRVQLSGGSDGAPPAGTAYAKPLRAVPADVSLIAAPGSSVFGDGEAIADALLACAAVPGAFRLAVLDLAPALGPVDARAASARWQSARAVTYYPWVRAAGTPELNLPPSGFLCGLYARSDAEYGVWKAPANLSLRSAGGLARAVDGAALEMLNPAGVNCLREFAGRGCVVWGARTLTADPEWRYVATRRYMDQLQVSITQGLRWVVFEPNDEPLWEAVRQQLEAFLIAQWRAGALHGGKLSQAFFVRCGDDTMSAHDIEQSRLLVEVGVALLRPAEFSVLRLVLAVGA